LAIATAAPTIAIPAPITPQVPTSLFAALWILRRATFCRIGLHAWASYDLRGTTALASLTALAPVGALCAVCTKLAA
jgi:hypothetical protein